MTAEDLNPSEEAVEESTPKPDEGSESEEMSDDEFNAILNGEEPEEDDDSEEESEKSETPSFDVEAYNKEFGTNFKTVEDIKESQRNLRKAVSDKGREKSKPKDNPVELENKFAEDILLARFPESIHVIDEVKELAKDTGKSVIDIYKDHSFLQKEANTRAEETNVDTSNNKKINTPDAGASVQKIDFSRMSADQFKQYKEKVLSQG